MKVLGWLGAVSLLVSSNLALADCAKAKAEVQVLWDRYWHCIETQSKEQSGRIEVDASGCKEDLAAHEAALARLTDIDGACADPAKPTFTDWALGPEAGVQVGYTSAGSGGLVIGMSVEPFAGLDPTMWSPASRLKGGNLPKAEFTLRFVDGKWAVDTLSVSVVDSRIFIIEHLGVSISDDFKWDTNRGEWKSNATAGIFTNLLKTAFSSLYSKNHVNVGVGARINIRDFYVVQDKSVNFQVPVSLDVAYTFLDGRLSVAALAEYAQNPLRVSDYTISAKAEGRYNLTTVYSERNQFANHLKYRIDTGVRYEFDYQNERATDFGTPDRAILNDRAVHKAVGFIEILY